MNATRAVAIRAAPAEVWPWLVQMGGHTRAGWYSFDHIDNGGRPSATEIVPDLQDLHVGDVLPTAPNGFGFTVEAIEPQGLLLMTIRDPRATITSTFVIEEVAPGLTRVINRLRLRPGRDPMGILFALAMDTGDIVFMARSLLGIKRRVEQQRARPAARQATGR